MTKIDDARCTTCKGTGLSVPREVDGHQSDCFDCEGKGFFDEDGEPIKQCCLEALPYSCGDCLGGTDADPYVNGSASGWYSKSDDYYDGGRLVRRSI